MFAATGERSTMQLCLCVMANPFFELPPPGMRHAIQTTLVVRSPSMTVRRRQGFNWPVLPKVERKEWCATYRMLDTSKEHGYV
jgi:hypothetical protein